MTTTVQKAPQSTEAWLKYSWTWSIIFYVAWLYQSYREIFHGVGNPPPEPLMIAILTTIAMGLYTWLWIRVQRTTVGLIQSTPFVTRMVVLIVLIWFVESLFAVSHLWALASIFILIYVYLPLRQSSIFVVVICTLAGIASQWWEGAIEFSWRGQLEQILLFMTFGLTSLLLAFWFDSIIKQSVNRRELLEELRVTQAELAKVEREKGILAERQRLAHEIHDTLAQGFTSIVMEMESAEIATLSEDKLALPHIRRARETARHNLQQARLVVSDLRSDELIELPFEQVMRNELSRWHIQTGVSAEFQSTGDVVALSPETEHTLLRILQESLNNIHKYASAQQVRVTTSYLSRCVIVDIQDDGVGIDATAGASSELSGGFGLDTMRERVEKLKGEFTVESDEEGTTIVAQIPLSQAVAV